MCVSKELENCVKDESWSTGLMCPQSARVVMCGMADGITRMVEVPKKIPVPSSVENVIPVINQMIGLKVLVRLGGFDQILSLIVYGVRHNISGIVSHNGILTDRKAGSQTDTGMFSP